MKASLSILVALHLLVMGSAAGAATAERLDQKVIADASGTHGTSRYFLPLTIRGPEMPIPIEYRLCQRRLAHHRTRWRREDRLVAQRCHCYG